MTLIKLSVHLSQHLLIVLTLINKGFGLQWVKFHVPEWVNVGENTVLTCEFDLQGDPLYSVKWYKAGREIYRYVPATNPPQGAFMMPGVIIDKDNSDDQHLVLNRVDFRTTGRFKCEVLTDGPFFKTLVKSSSLQIVDLPKGNPLLTGKRDEYRLGELINITCSTSPSVPPAVLTWFINEREAIPAELAPRLYYHQYNPSDVLRPMPSSLRLEVIASRNHFRRGLVTLLCRARIQGLHDSRVIHTAREASSLRPSLLEGHAAGAIQRVDYLPLLLCALATQITKYLFQAVAIASF